MPFLRSWHKVALQPSWGFGDGLQTLIFLPVINAEDPLFHPLSSILHFRLFILPLRSVPAAFPPPMDPEPVCRIAADGGFK